MQIFANQTAKLKQKYPTIIVNTKCNNIRHQDGSSECGVYCLYFIRSRLEGTAFARFLNARISDEAMILFRRYIFDITPVGRGRQ
jgi:Ulp1 family protease